MIVVASAMTLATGLLSAPSTLVVGRRRARGLWLGRGSGFGFAAEDATFPFADFPLELLNLCRQSSFALDGPLMLRPPIAGLPTQFANETPQQTQGHQSEPKEHCKLAKAPPQKGGLVRFRIMG